MYSDDLAALYSMLWIVFMILAMFLNVYVFDSVRLVFIISFVNLYVLTTKYSNVMLKRRGLIDVRISGALYLELVVFIDCLYV